MLNKRKKIIFTSVLVVLIMIITGSVLLTPHPVQAFGVGVPQPSIVVEDVVQRQDTILNKIWRAVEKGLKVARDITFRNQLNQFLQNLAFNAAVKLATGDAGQKPLFEVFSGEQLWESLRDQAIGEFSAQLLTSTNQGKCEVNSSIQCQSDAECPLVYVNPDGSSQVVKDENERQFLLAHGARSVDFRNSKCAKEAIAQLGGIDICRIQSPAAEIRIKNITLNLLTPPKPQCTYNDLKENFENLKNIDTGGLVKVRDIYNQESNDISIILNLTSQAIELDATKKAGELIDKISGGSFKAVKNTVTGENKTPPELVGGVVQESFFKSFDTAAVQTGSLVADAIGTFTNTLASRLLKQIFDKGLTSDSSGLISNRFFGGLSGVAAAKLKFAELLKLTDIKSQAKSSDSLLQDFVTGCSDEVRSTELGALPPDAFREVNNCIIDESFRLAIEQKLTVREAIKQGLLSTTKDFGVHSDGTDPGALAGTSCQGCDPNLLSLRSILVLRKHRVVPVGWELAARYIQEVLQTADPQPSQLSFNLSDLAADRQGRTTAYSDSNSPFYRLIDPDWQLKAPSAIQEIRGSGERIVSDFPVRDQDTNNDGRIDGKDNPRRIIQRGVEPADEQTCIYENQDGSCAYFGYCTEEKPIWRIAGQQCNPLDPHDNTFNTCQTFIRGSDTSQVTYMARSVDENSCSVDNVGCRRFATNRDTDTFDWIISDLSDDNIFIDRSAAECNPDDSGCSEFLRLTNIAGNILTAPEVDQAIIDVQAIPGEIDDYRDIALVETLYLNGDRIDCTAAEDYDSNGFFDDNVACRSYKPRSFSGPNEIPGVVTAATVDSDGVITAYNDECPAECVGYQPYEEVAIDPLYPNATDINFIAATANTCSVQAVGCTEFTNLNEVALGGEGLEYYTSLRECRTEDFASQVTYFTWEGSDETGFQLRSWQLVPGGSGGGPLHSGDSDYDLCTASIFGLSPDDPEANPDCREYIDTSLNRFYALHSRVIFVTEECQPLRRTLTDINYDGSVTDSDCTEAGGDPQSNGCIYFGLPELSQSCSANVVDCRQYRGFGSGNTQIIINDTFESGTTEGWVPAAGGSAVLSNESVILGGHSLDFTGTATKPAVIEQNEQYIVSFWARTLSGTSGTLDVFISNPAIIGTFGEVDVGAEWQEYSLGPIQISTAPLGTEVLEFSGGGDFFIDNIRLTKSSDLYLISKSWTTPLTCDVTIDGDSTDPNEHDGTSNESQLFCEEYLDDQRQTKYIKSFTRLCEEEFVGCEALVDTHNSDAAEALDSTNIPILAGGPTAIDDVSIPADEIAYLVNDEQYYCSSSAAGCIELGLITTDRESNIQTNTQYRILDPEQYETSLCTAEGELCESFSPTGSSAGFPQYFKDPQDRLCEYRTHVLVEGLNILVTGWFRVDAQPATVEDICQAVDPVPTLDGEPFPFNTEAELCNYIDGDFDLINADNTLSYPPGCYSYSCPAEMSSCSEFQDPITPEGCDPQARPGESWCDGVVDGTSCLDDADCGGLAGSCVDVSCDYYYFLRDTLDPAVSECRGQIDPGIGCVGFYETDRGDESKFLRADCQTNCQLVLECYNDDTNTFLEGVSCSTDADCGADVCRGVPVREFPDCTLDRQLLNPNSKPGCNF